MLVIVQIVVGRQAQTINSRCVVHKLPRQLGQVLGDGIHQLVEARLRAEVAVKVRPREALTDGGIVLHSVQTRFVKRARVLGRLAAAARRLHKRAAPVCAQRELSGAVRKRCLSRAGKPFCAAEQRHQEQPDGALRQHGRSGSATTRAR